MVLWQDENRFYLFRDRAAGARERKRARFSCRKPDNTLAEGVYTALTRRGNDTFPSLAFFVAARTFGEEEKQLEVHILDFQGQLYGETLTVTLLEKMRGNIHFATEEELVAQMRQDEQEARSFFSTIACL